MRFITPIAILLSLAPSILAACTCSKVSNPGLYCWYCAEVKTGWKVDHVYECNKNGGCHDYGTANNCKSGNPTYCDGRDSWKREDLERRLEASEMEDVE